MRYIHGWKRQTVTVIGLVLILSFIVACGSAAPAAPDPAAEPTQAPTQAPAQPTATSVAEAAPTSQPPEVSRPEGTLNVGLVEMGPFVLHPSTLGNPQIFVQGTAPIGEALLQQDINREFKGLLAESWSISEDFLTWTFKLHKGVQFHKGYGEMTSEDVIWSMRQWGLSKHPRAGQIADFWAERPGTEAPGPYTVVVNSGEPVVDVIAQG
jgi:ABC-type transport system substrate-binding protein